MERPNHYKFIPILPDDLKHKFNNIYRRGNISVLWVIPFLFLLPRIVMKVWSYINTLEIWKIRIDDKRRQKMAYDFMIFTLAEKEKDIIYENSLL